jgi:predicted MFS family arabinose efflux permease
MLISDTAVDGPAAPPDVLVHPLVTAVQSPSIYRNLALWLLMLVSAMNFLDRQVTSILAEPMKHDLHLSDTQIGMMTGLAFAVFYTVLGIPVARYSDKFRTNRATLIAISLGVWSLFTALCGLAQTFNQLIAARIGVGAGEAGCTPPSHSLISDSYPLEKRAPALAFYGLGLPLGTLLGMSLGGGFADLFGWRTAFLLLGIPGILVGLVVWWLVPEPRKAILAANRGVVPEEHDAPSFMSVLHEVGRSPAFLYLMAAMTTGSFLSYGKGVWHAVFLIRVHHVSPGMAGIALGLVSGIGSGFGAWLGGYCAARFGAMKRQHILTATVLGLLVSIPLTALAYWVADWRLAAFLMLAHAVTSGLAYGPTFTCLQGLVRPSSRGAATAIFLLVQNLVGLGFGPMLFGMLSDAIHSWAGIESVRYVLYLSVPMTLIPAFCFWQSSLHLDREMRQ